MKKLLFSLLFITLVFTKAQAQQQIYQYKGDYNIFYGVVISTMGITSTGSAASLASYSTVPLISSVTYNSKYDWLIEIDNGGSDVYISSFTSFSITKLECAKKIPGSVLSPQGRLTDSVFARTLTGLTTVWISLSGKR